MRPFNPYRVPIDRKSLEIGHFSSIFQVEWDVLGSFWDIGLNVEYTLKVEKPTPPQPPPPCPLPPPI